MDKSIRPMQPADLDAVYAIERKAHAFPWTRGILQDCLRVNYACWVFEQQQAIKAFVIMTIGAGEAHILNLCVKPACQQQGLGGQLLQFILQQARAQGCKTVFLEVRRSNQAAIHLYNKFGFTKLGERKHYYPAQNGREDGIMLRLAL